jgi:5-methyltetrahydropteroyltriglutamate--homocysteine methyltransferase
MSILNPPFRAEYDDERSGDFAPLRFVPAPKKVVLGLVSSKIKIGEMP